MPEATTQYQPDAIGVRYGRTISIPSEYGGGTVDWSSVDVTDPESVRSNLPPCQARAELEMAHMAMRRMDMLIHSLVGASGDDLFRVLGDLSDPQHLGLNQALSPSIMRYLNDIARANRGIGVRMDHQDDFSRAVSSAVQGGGPVDYRSISASGSSVAPARDKVRDEDVSYINEEGY